jgi:hypothetical protein
VHANHYTTQGEHANHYTTQGKHANHYTTQGEHANHYITQGEHANHYTTQGEHANHYTTDAVPWNTSLILYCILFLLSLNFVVARSVSTENLQRGPPFLL